MAIDREKLITRLVQMQTSYDAKGNFSVVADINKIIDEIESGAFDIKPHEGRTGQPLRVPGEPEWEDETND